MKELKKRSVIAGKDELRIAISYVIFGWIGFHSFIVGDAS